MSFVQPMGIPSSVSAYLANQRSSGLVIDWADKANISYVVIELVHMESTPYHVHANDIEVLTSHGNLCSYAGAWSKRFICGSGAKGWETSFAASFCLV